MPITTETHPHRHHHGESKQAEEVEPTAIVAKVNDLDASPTEESIIIADNTEEKENIDKEGIKKELETTVAITTPTLIERTSPVTAKVSLEDALYDDYDIIDEDDEDDYNTITILPPVVGKHESPRESTVAESTTAKIEPETVDFIPETTPIIVTTSTTKAPTTQEMITTSTTKTTSTTPSTTSTTVVTSPVVISSTQTSATSPITSAIVTTAIDEIPETTQTAETTSSTTVPPPPPTEKITLPVTTSTTTEKLTTLEDLTTSKQTTVRHVPTTHLPTTRIVTETLFETRNFPPTLQNRLKRIAVTAGTVFSFFIPKDTFSDAEDGSELKLEFLDREGIPINKDSWCQFNSSKKEIYGL